MEKNVIKLDTLMSYILINDGNFPEQLKGLIIKEV
jgi:hypothetical protein